LETATPIKRRLFYLCCAVFIIANALLISQEFYYFSFLPLLLFIGYWLFFSLDKFILLIAFTTPFSVKLEDFDINVGVSIPTEPLMFAVLLLFVIKVLYDYNFLERRILKHPISIAVLLNLLWLFITSITSEYPIVSFKFLTARLWFVVTFFFFGVLLFKDVHNIKRFVWVYCISLSVVILYNTINHSFYGFERQVGTWIVHPFFNDHTAYGSVIALFVPFMLTFIFHRENKFSIKMLSLGLLLVLLTGILLSYSRAAWVSLVGALGVFLILRLRISFRYVFAFIALLSGLFFIYRTEIMMELEKNKQDSSGKYTEHIRSISNISTDASNLERINRWASAIRMFKDRPVFGWGPGTYQLVYAPFQYSKEKTLISTNAGDMGNAHSEYIGPLSESGVLGMLTVLFIVISVFVTGVKVYKRAKSGEIRILSLAALLGLCTYYIHGVMNNFLDTDKASVPFWALTAMILVLDVYHKDNEEGEYGKGEIIK